MASTFGLVPAQAAMTIASLFEGFDRVITLGPEGTFSDQAAALVALGKREIRYTSTLPQVALAVVQDPLALGVIPVENSSSGIVGPAQDSLVENPVVILAEIQILVTYGLLSQVPLEEVESFYCHQVAFDQIMTFTAKHLPQAKVIFSDSNMDSAERFAQLPLGSKTAAVVPKLLAAQDPRFAPYLKAEGLEDYQNNCTRFLVFKKRPEEYQPDFSRKKTSLLIEMHEDRHSLLFEILREFHVFGINLCRLESRPSKVHAWQYRFFIDFYNSPKTQFCLDQFREAKISFQLLGSYDSLT